MMMIFRMHLCGVYLLISIAYQMLSVYGTDVVTLQGNLTIPKQGDSIRLSCLVQDTYDNPITWYYQSILRTLGLCYRSVSPCIGVMAGYNVTADQKGSYLDIGSLNRSLHEGIYICTFRSSDGIDHEKSLSITVYGTDVVTLQGNLTIPKQGDSIRLSCLVQDTYDNPIIWYYQSITRLGQCYRSPYCSGVLSGYIITADQYGTYLDIGSLNRSLHEGIYVCNYHSAQGKGYNGTINIIVYAIPQGLEYIQAPTADTDLILSSVTIQCKTNGCTYPPPSINWFYRDQGNQSIFGLYMVTIGSASSVGSCLPKEDTYTSTLKIPMYTTWTDNTDKTVRFSCGIEYSDSSRNVYSADTGTVRFAVSVTAITLQNSSTGTFVFYDGFSQRVKCTSSPSRPVPTIRWMLETPTGTVQLTDNITNTDVIAVDGLYVWTSEITLTLRKVNRNQKIFCSGNIDGQQIAVVSSKVTIDVWYQPTKPEVQEYGAYFPWLENQNGTLKCNSSDYGNPTSNVSWISWTGNTDINGHLVIKGLAWSDHRKMVSCELINRYTIDKDVHAVSEPIYLNVEYSPRIQFNTTSPLTVNETQFLSVSCSATGNPNPNQIFWSGRPNGSWLRFENISRNDNGTYMCNATANSSKYGTLRNQMEFNIIVQYAPVVKVTVTGSTLQNMTSLITCEAIGFPAVYTFYPWKHMWGETIIRSGLQGMPTGSTDPIQNILILERLSLQDMGTYVCFAENRIKGFNGEFIQKAAMDLNIMGIPVVLKEEEFHFAELAGHSINISIPFYSNPAIKSFIFQKNGTGLQNNSRTTMILSTSVIDSRFYGITVKLEAAMANLFIQNLTQDDFDNYTLVLVNFLGIKEFRLQLEAAGPPQEIDIFDFIRFIENKIELHFNPGFNGGRVQTFVIEYRSTASPYLPWKNSSVTDLKETQTYNGTYFVNVTMPPPGTYEYRMYSWNEIGRSPYSVVIKIVIPQVPSVYKSSELSVAGIAGGVSAGIVIILVVVIGIFLWRRYQRKLKTEHDKDVTGEDEESTRSQIKAISVKQDVDSGKEYERLHFTEAAATQYLQLNDIMSEESRNSNKRSPEGDSYEKLQSYANSDIQMYSSLKIHNISKDSEKDYENTIKRPDITSEYQ